MRWGLIISAVWAALALHGLSPDGARAQAQTQDESAQAAEDRGYLQGLLEDNLSGAGREVRITGFEGALSSQATIERMTIADDAGVWITLSDLVLDWNRGALLRGRLEINTLSAATIDLPRLPGTDPGVTPEAATAREFSLPDLPVSVDIGAITVERVTLGEAILGEVVALRVAGNLSLAGGAGAADLSIARRDGRGAFTLAAGYANETDILALDLALEEDEGGIVTRLLGLPGEPALALSVAGEDPLSDYTARIMLSSDGAERLGGTVEIREDAADTGGPDGTRRFSAMLDGDVRPLFAPEFRPFFGAQSALQLAGRYAPSGALDLSELSIRAAAVSLSGRLALDPGGWPTSFDLSGTLGGAGAVRLPSAGPATFIDSARISAAFDAAAGNEWRAVIGFDGFVQEALSVSSGRLRASGVIRPDAPQGVSADIAFNTRGVAHDDPALARALGTALDGSLRADWTEGAPLRIAALDVASGDIRLTGAGTLGAFDAGFPVTGEASLRAAELARLAPLLGRDLAGSVMAQLSGSGALLSGAFDLNLSAQAQDLQLDVARLDPLLAGASSLDVVMARDTGGTELKRLDIRSAAMSLEAAGRTDDLSGRVTLAARMPDVARAEPRLTGPAEARGSLSWEFGGDVTVEQLELDVARSRVTASGTVSPEMPGLPVAGQIAAQIPDLARFSALSGQRLAGEVTARLEGNAALETGLFDLTAALDGTGLRTGIAPLDTLLTGAVRLRADGGRSTEALNIRRISLETGQLELTATTVEDTQGAQGTQGTQGAPLDMVLRLADLGLFAPDFSGPLAASGRVQLIGPEARDITLDLSATGPGGTTATVQGRVLDHGARLALDLAGAAPLGLANQLIAPQSITGSARYDLRIDGPPALSALSGTLTTAGARVALPGPGVAIEDIGGTIALSGGQAQTALTGRLREGGTLSVSGPITLTAPYPADLTAELSAVRLTDNMIYTTQLDGTATVTGPLTAGAVIGGTITLDETEIRIPSSSAASSVIFEDMTHLGAPRDVQQTRRFAGLLGQTGGSTAAPLGLDLVINAPRRMFVRGRGLDAELAGRIRLGGTTADVVPSGFFQLIRGRLDLLGKRLVLTEGLVDMRGALDPYLRFVAETTAQDVIVRIVAEGLASDIEILFESEPDLPQEEIVSQLLLGRGVDSISPLQAAQLASAVATLAGRSENDVVGRLRSSIGLSDLDVSTTEEGTTELRAGAYISENVYSEVTADSEGRQEINLNLDVSRNVTVRGGVDSEGGTGLGVFFEKDY